MAPTDADTFDREGVPCSTQRDALSVLKTAPGFFASKQIIARDGEEPEIRGFNAGTWFHAYEWGVSNIVELSSALTTLETMPNCFVIRGASRGDLDLRLPQRRRKINFQTPPSGRRWLLIDLDKIKLPAGMSLQQDIGAVCEHLVGLLPVEFHEASYHWQLSSSAGIKDPTVASLHLWFWLDRPIPDAPLKAWSKEWNATAVPDLIDTLLFNDVQAHYTAAPIFVGLDDPFPVRSGLTRKAVDEVALKLPRAQKQSALRVGTRERPLESSGGFETILAQIGDHPGGAGFHRPIIRAAASYAATHGREGTDVEALFAVIRARVLAADRSQHDDAHIEAMASRQHIVRAIEEALIKYAQPGNPRRKSRQLPELPPHFTSESVVAAEASAMLEAAIDRFFGAAR